MYNEETFMKTKRKFARKENADVRSQNSRVVYLPSRCIDADSDHTLPVYCSSP
jgi:hypothetical protein